MALSTTEAEYMDLTEAVKEAIWLKGLLEELGVKLNRVTVNCDNQGAIHLSRNHLEEGFIVRLDEYRLRTSVDNTMVIKVLRISVIHTQCHIIGHPKPFPYSVTPSVKDYYRVSLPPDEHPLLKWRFLLPQRNLNNMSACLEKSEELEWGTESEDGFIMNDMSACFK
uniref:Retrovirus-related Pol polyprotein from transposon TNT 1-94 n=1 Tax=Tanacetum cinerariifolium TaxID=118510 RepID=A0A6L2P1C3_TANCI|nr:retrovirus-related Pol polyprotein from transposon TNT 1-94 [Tanacetum cinerariifolium]